jgi:hypothetical protein
MGRRVPVTVQAAPNPRRLGAGVIRLSPVAVLRQFEETEVDSGAAPRLEYKGNGEGKAVGKPGQQSS